MLLSGSLSVGKMWLYHAKQETSIQQCNKQKILSENQEIGSLKRDRQLITKTFMSAFGASGKVEILHKAFCSVKVTEKHYKTAPERLFHH